MADLSCTFLEIPLQNPIIIECNTINVEEIIQHANSGVGAIILKPIYEEELVKDIGQIASLITTLESGNDIANRLNNCQSDNYLNSIIKLKKSLQIPVIASIDCVSDGAWIDYAMLLESAGADAIQLTIFSFPDDKDFRSTDYEKSYYEIATKVTYNVKIPVYLKLIPQFTNLLNTIDQLFYRGIQGVSLFCNYGSRDIDILEFESIPVDDTLDRNNFFFSLKWLEIISSLISKLDLASYSNSNKYEDAIKFILAGANAVIINEKYIEDSASITNLISKISEWMNMAGFTKIEHFHGQMNYQEPIKLSSHERELYLKRNGVTIG